MNQKRDKLYQNYHMGFYIPAMLSLLGTAHFPSTSSLKYTLPLKDNKADVKQPM